MAKNRRYFVISDTHFGHDKTWSTFKLSDGVTPLRNFTSSEEMDQHMIDCWNEVVRDDDVVYHLGDVVINNKHLHRIHALRGHKRLVLGNHDCVVNTVQDFLDAGFEAVFGVTKPQKFPFYLSHIPLDADSIPYPQSVDRHGEKVTRGWCKANIHGHLHGRRKMITDKWGNRIPSPLHYCVSVENVNYTPVNLEEIVEYVTMSPNRWGETYCWDQGENDSGAG